MAAERVSSSRQTILLLFLILAERDGVCRQLSKNRTLYLLSLLSYPNNITSLKQSFSDADSIIPGAHLAVSDINNRSDVLADYELELVTANDGCNIGWIGVINLIDNLYYKEGKQIVGIVGPECSDSTKEVASITGRPEIALLNVHLGIAPELANRTLYPYSYGIYPPASANVDALIALFRYNKWTRAAVLYNPDMLVDYSSYKLFDEKIKNTPSQTYTFYASPDHLPLEQLRRSYVRVIVAFLRDETLNRVLCLAYFKNITYPRYQWILSNSNEVRNVSFLHEGNKYECSGEQMVTTLSHSVLVTTLSHSVMVTTENTYDSIPFISDIKMTTINEACQDHSDCYSLFDAVWAIALALNYSIEPLRVRGLSLSDYIYGKLSYTEIIKEQMNMVSFKGQYGSVQFNASTGYILNYTSTFYNSDNYLIPIGTFSFPNGVLDIDSRVAAFVPTNFKEKPLLVSIPLAVVIITVEAVAAAMVIMIHILNTVYSHRATIKISSRRLNHFAYTGCYFVLIGILLYTIMETFNINEITMDMLCKCFPWTVIIGLTLVFGTVLAKVWRAFIIFHSSLKRKKSSKVLTQDRSLIAMIVTLVSLSAVFCLTWTFHDPLVRTTDENLATEGDDLVLEIKTSCTCTNEVVWVVVGIAHEAVIMMCTVLFAFLTRKFTIKELKSQGTILMAYFITLTSIVGFTIYYITEGIGIETNVPYAILCFSLIIIVYLCIILLFIPPVLPVMKEWLVVKKLITFQVIKYLLSWLS